MPEHLKIVAEERAAAGGYESVDGYIASLIEADVAAPISSETEAEILKGLDSGSAMEIASALLNEIKQKARGLNHQNLTIDAA